MESQGKCETTLTERYLQPDCKCQTYEGNTGPCATYEEGANQRCVYCDHTLLCHIQLLQYALTWALDMLDIYDKRFLTLGSYINARKIAGGK